MSKSDPGEINDPERRRRRIDSVHVRCAAALALGLLSLWLVIEERKLSLIPLMLGLSLIMRGKAAQTRHAPPITFLLLVPIIVAIVVLFIARR
ncbi:hypothetical protein [Frondihabitans cladoniiphilus]|uniref:MYXO-CTERM domain-containing protein n=1 Tax=Frondihabitans cladoniiphilus TaxID=715785 RepID=A0ABP8WDG2_9MICO